MPPRNTTKRSLPPASRGALSKKGAAAEGHASRKTRKLDPLARMLRSKPVLPEDPVRVASIPDAKGESTRTFGAHVRGRLAVLGHAMLLIAHLQRAQQGAPLSQRTPAGSEPSIPSIKLNRRWLEAVTAYCGTTVGVDDVARVAAAFPNWVHVRWGVGETPWGMDGLDGGGDGRSRGLRPLSIGLTKADLLPEASALSGTRERGAMPAAEELTARLYILASHVPSIEEAGEELQKFLQTKDASESEDWLDKIVQRRALDAYREQQLVECPDGSTRSAQPSFGDTLGRPKQPEVNRTAPLPSGSALDSGGVGPCKATSSSPTVLPRSLVSPTGEQPPHDDEDSENDAVLLAMLSPELKASLSAAKLKEVVQFMKREATNASAEELAKIERKQEEERLLSTYAHVRSLFGREKTELNAAWLLERLAVESLFEDHRRILPQLSLLLNRSSFGLSAVTLSRGEDGAVRSPIGGTVALLGKVDDFEKLTGEELENTLVLLDRTKASLKGICRENTFKAGEHT